MTIEDIEKWEEENDKIPDGAVLIMYSGTGQYYGNKTEYFGWPPGVEENDPTNTKDLHFPGISREAAEWIVENRYIVK